MGEGVVDMFVGMVYNNEIGLLVFLWVMLISGLWVEGEMVRLCVLCVI